MTYAFHGLSAEQTQDLVDDLKKQAFVERRDQKEDHPDFTLKDTQAAKQFAAICGMDLFTTNKDNRQTIKQIQQSLLAPTEEATTFLDDYVVAHVLPKVEIFDHQVCSHGRNTFSMSQSNLGYSGIIR